MLPDLVIVGGGVGGAVLALALGRRGWTATIIERERAPHAPARPEVLHASTFDSLDALAIGERLRTEASIPLEGVDIHQGERLLASISPEDLRHAGAAPRSVEPGRLRAIILDAAVATGRVTLRHGATVDALVFEHDRAVGVSGADDGGPFEQRARLIVGDDGGRSVVRSALGIPIVVRRFPVEVVAVRLPRPAALSDTRARIWIGSGEPGPLAAGFVPLPARDALLVMPFRADGWKEMTAAPDRFWSSLSSITPIAPTIRDALTFPGDFSRFHLSFGHAERYSDRGAVLIGDAAHPMSPAGGQGANAAIADALALASVVDSAMAKGAITGDELMAYERRRRPANTRSLAFSRRAAGVIRWSHWIPGSAALASQVLRLAGKQDKVKQQLLHHVATAFLERPDDAPHA